MASAEPRRGIPPSAVLFACLFAGQAAILVLSPILPQVAAEFDVGIAVAAQLRSVSGIVAGVTALVLAVTGSRFRLTRLLSTGLILLLAGSAASAVAPDFAVLLGAQIVIGVGLALVLSGALAASEAWSTGEGRTRALSWALVGAPVAWIVGQPVIGLVAPSGWRWAWVAVPIVSSIAALATVAWGSPSGEGTLECDPLGLWRLPGVKTWAIAELATLSAWAGTLVFAGAFFSQVHGSSVRVVGIVLGVVAAAYVPGNFLARRRLAASPGLLLVGSGVALTGGVIAFGWARSSLALSVGLLALLSFLAGGRTLAGAAVGLKLADGRRLAAMSVRTATLQFGYLVGTAVGGLALDAWGYTGLGITFGALFLVAALAHLGRIGRSGPTEVLRR